MKGAALRVSAAACFWFSAACGELPKVPSTQGAGGSCPDLDEVTGEAISGGSPEPCECAVPPKPLRVVHVVDSRGLDPNTLVMAESPDPQTLWLPDAADNFGAFVVVKEARGEARRITVIDLGDGDSTREYESSAAWSSRTFVAVDNDSSSRSWLLLDDAAP
jgi:hypothetical protein